MPRTFRRNAASSQAPKRINERDGMPTIPRAASPWVEVSACDGEASVELMEVEEEVDWRQAESSPAYASRSRSAQRELRGASITAPARLCSLDSLTEHNTTMPRTSGVCMRRDWPRATCNGCFSRGRRVGSRTMSRKAQVRVLAGGLVLPPPATIHQKWAERFWLAD